MHFLPDELIEAAAEGDPRVLAELDARGMIAAPGESAAEFAHRLRTLRENLAELRRALDEDGEIRVGGLRLRREQTIPPDLFEEAGAVTDRLYGFRVDWVPGFFVDPRASWLFGGCAYFQHPDWLALFIIRRSFVKRQRWLIYRRDELIAHELCHVARAGLGSSVFEEHLAYRSSKSRFRRVVGPVVRRPVESYALLGCSFLLLAVQVARVTALPGLAIIPFWCLLGGVVAFLVARLQHERRVLRTATANVEALFPGHGDHAVCRLTDQELGALARCRTREQTEEQLPRDLRTQVMRRRFSTNNAEAREDSALSSPSDGNERCIQGVKG